ncbi:MAG: FAD-binding oxidoreductase [Acidimicrobiales bacterium]|nr:FAD-binding oxidoreductase [Acidimicrobiales bacterium]
MRATIVGGGVSGLTTAVAMREAGWDAHVVARELYDSTVSMVAAAVWTATMLEPHESTRRWALATRTRFASLSEDPASGVVPMRQRELDRCVPSRSWWETTPYVRRLGSDAVPAPYAGGFEIDGFGIEPPVYLRWLTTLLAKLGGTITVGEVDRLVDVEGDIVLNCSGLGAADLADDPTVHPIRGQVVAVTNPGIRDGVTDHSDAERAAYVYPRSEEVILGGTRQIGCTDLEPDPVITQRILTDSGQLDGRVAQLDVLDVRVGLRPGRPSVRVERDELADGRAVVHNYGHAGAGFLLSWGCAQDVVKLTNTLNGRFERW